MPAIERRFTERPPARLYVDTDFVLTFLVAGRDHHADVAAFLGSVATSASTTIYVSSLLWMELAHTVTRRSVRDDLPRAIQEAQKLEQWEQDPLVRETYLRGMVGALDALLEQFDTVEVPLGPDVRGLAVEYVAQYNLGSQDAIHLATAVLSSVFDFASLDRGYRRVDGLHLWNNQIFGT